MPALLGALCAGLALFTSSLPQQCQKPRLADSPWFCHDLDCPPYDLVQTLDVDLELRAYRAGWWCGRVGGRPFMKLPWWAWCAMPTRAIS